MTIEATPRPVCLFCELPLEMPGDGIVQATFYPAGPEEDGESPRAPFKARVHIECHVHWERVHEAAKAMDRRIDAASKEAT